MHDIVYILRNDIETDEIRYSLRSVANNFPFNSIWIYGGKPKGIEPDHYVKYKQLGDSRYMKVANTLREICKNEDITEQFYLFNDDFFIMRPVEDFPIFYCGTLWERCDKIRQRHGRDSAYSKNLRETAELLKRKGYDQLDYALHCPILIDRRKALETLDKFSGYPMFRSLYGNHHSIGGQLSKDHKIQNTKDRPGDWLFVSTSDRSYRYGAVGRSIRTMFNKPSRFEV